MRLLEPTENAEAQKATSEKLLDRPFSLNEVRSGWPGIEQEAARLVDRACALLRRCEDSSSDDSSNIAPLILYRSIIELFDGISVLAIHSCTVPLLPVLRSLFEATVSLEYIMKDGRLFKQRSLSWLHGSIKKRIQLWEQHDLETPIGKEFDRETSKATGVSFDPHKTSAFDRACKERAQAAREVVNSQFGDIEREFKKTKKRAKRKPEWYSLFGGPTGFRDLVGLVDRAPQYHLIYRPLSHHIHSQETGLYVGGDNKSGFGLRRLREPGNLSVSWPLAVNFFWSGTQVIQKNYLPADRESIEFSRDLSRFGAFQTCEKSPSSS